MKFLLIAILVVLCICQESCSEAVRSKRATSLEQCPENSTHDECVAYAKGKFENKKSKNCVRYAVSHNQIVWHSCGVRLCVDSYGNTYRAKGKDLTKPYPECCPKCPKNKE